MRVILFGSPGSGKGTQATLLADFLGVRKISLGDILRGEVRKNSSLGQEVKSYMERGALVSDELVSRVIEENVNNSGFLLDGYPRNLSQAKKLEEILIRKNSDIDRVVYLDIDEQIIVDRLSKRRVCKSCGANYHLVSLPSKKEGICDKCGGELTQRKDDDPQVIKKRWAVFTDEANKILEFYQNKNKLIKVDGRGDIEEIFERIKQELK
ncbi:MAG: adenylate kinase [Candidatus Omnitrophica bacterium]|nr:adenylate kinase [Candidatus Omnitrophota bacterium]